MKPNAPSPANIKADASGSGTAATIGSVAGLIADSFRVGAVAISEVITLRTGDSGMTCEINNFRSLSARWEYFDPNVSYDDISPMKTSISKFVNKKFFWTSFIILGVFSMSAQAINCEIARNFSEKTICSSALLINLDKALNQNYKGMLYSDLGKGADRNVRKAQRKWISKVNKCKTEACILDLYRSQLYETCEYGVVSGVHVSCDHYDDIFENSPEFIGPKQL